MTAALDQIITLAKIVAPDDPALGTSGLRTMKILLAITRASGAPRHIIQYANGISAMVVGDPDDTESRREILAQVHQVVLTGLKGPISTKEK